MEQSKEFWENLLELFLQSNSCFLCLVSNDFEDLWSEIDFQREIIKESYTFTYSLPIFKNKHRFEDSNWNGCLFYPKWHKLSKVENVNRTLRIEFLQQKIKSYE